ncbi:MAG: twin-arginine translocation signal domain-containing protein [Planctomycetota bacterium]
MIELSRRSVLQASAAMGCSVAASSWLNSVTAAEVKTTQTDATGFFTLGKQRSHWWLISPQGTPFFSMGLNHIDPASLRYPENLHLWRERYGGSTLRWIEESVVPNLKAWGFNTVGWVQEVTVKKWRHSRAFTIDEYRALDMPYCHLLPFTESHQWEKHTVHYDFRSEDWKEWVDYVARSHCAELAEERDLIGYFYSDCPTWIHDRPDNQWRGPIFDPDRLKTTAGRKELYDLAHQYYKTTHDAIRRYDKHHLLFGDRYEANAPIAMEVIDASVPYVDVLSFQDFQDPVLHLDQWHRQTGKPVLLADAAGVNFRSDEFFKPNNGAWYAKTLGKLFENPGCVGFHLCGAYQRNKSRRRGLLDEMENPDRQHLDQMTAANERITEKMATVFQSTAGDKP